MRVLGSTKSGGGVSGAVMGKKKHRIRKAERNEWPGDGSSDEGGNGGTLCSHIGKGVNIGLVRKAVKQIGFSGNCTVCEEEGGKKIAEESKATLGESEEGVDSIEVLPVWLCLQCGHQGCGRNSPCQHALKHFQTPRSTCHALALCIGNWQVWCYDCDNDIPAECSKRLLECVEYVRKQHQGPAHSPLPVKKSGAVTSKRDVVRPSNEESSSVVAGGGGGSTGSDTTVQHLNSKSQTASLLPKVKGLSNLGNTCFFNAVMQNLCQTPILETQLQERVSKTPLRLSLIGGGGEGAEEAEEVSESEDNEESEATPSVEEDSKLQLEPLSLSLPEAGILSTTVLSFLRDMKPGASAAKTSGVITPSSLFGQVCKKSPRFKGFQQQDSHELLRCLLDGMKAEEIKRSQAAILRHFNISPEGSGKAAKSKVDDTTRQSIKAYGHQVKHTFVDSVFGGVFISTVHCQECNQPSQIFEPFLDLSLPVTEEKSQRPNYGGGGKKEAVEEGTSDRLDEIFCATNATTRQPSKYMAKKERRKAKKEAKWKGKHGKAGADRKSGDESPGGENNDSPKEHWDQEDSGPNDNDNTKEGLSAKSASVSVEDVRECEDDGEREMLSFHNDKNTGESLGMCLEQIHIQTRHSTNQMKAGSSEGHVSGSSDNDSNKVNVSGSEQNLSELEADIEDNLESTAGGANSDPGMEVVEEDINNFNPMLDGPGQSALSQMNDQQRADTLRSSSDQNLDCLTKRTEELNGRDSRSLPDIINNTQTKDCVDGSTARKLNCSQADIADASGITEAINAFKIDDSNSYQYNKHDIVLSKNGNRPSNKEYAQSSPRDRLPPSIGGRITPKDGDGTSLKSGDESMVKGADSAPTKDVVCSEEDGDVALKEDVYKSNILKSRKPSVGRPNTPQSPNLSRQNSTNVKPSTPKASEINRKGKAAFREARLEAMHTLAPRPACESRECSVQSCLNQFTSAELLTASNKFGCQRCTRRKYTGCKNTEKRETVYTVASKQLLVFLPPAVLTLHLKRFQQVGFSLRKVSRHVDFPLQLDLAPYCSTLAQGVKAGQRQVLYSLYGIVEHSGRLSGGHYTAYVKVRPQNLQDVAQFLQTTDLRNPRLDVLLHSRRHPSSSTEAPTSSHVTPGGGKWYYISDSRVCETSEAKVLQCQAYLLFYERIL